MADEKPNPDKEEKRPAPQPLSGGSGEPPKKPPTG